MVSQNWSKEFSAPLFVCVCVLLNPQRNGVTGALSTTYLVLFPNETSSGVMNFKDPLLSSSKSSEHWYWPVTLLRASAQQIEEFRQTNGTFIKGCIRLWVCGDLYRYIVQPSYKNPLFAWGTRISNWIMNCLQVIGPIASIPFPSKEIKKSTSVFFFKALYLALKVAVTWGPQLRSKGELRFNRGQIYCPSNWHICLSWASTL